MAAAMAVNVFFMGRSFVGSSKVKDQRDRSYPLLVNGCRAA